MKTTFFFHKQSKNGILQEKMNENVKKKRKEKENQLITIFVSLLISLLFFYFT